MILVFGEWIDVGQKEAQWILEFKNKACAGCGTTNLFKLPHPGNDMVGILGGAAKGNHPGFRGSTTVQYQGSYVHTFSPVSP